MTHFSKTLAERTRANHSESEGASFMADLMRGTGTLDDYTALSSQHYFIYEAIEESVSLWLSDPVAGTFFDEALTRLPAIRSDLRFLIGDDWRSRIAPLPTTDAYTARIREVGRSWAGGLIAHHYTRYLGDLSGGQFIARLIARHYGLSGDGLAFYDFPGILEVEAFKDDYRAKLDTAQWDAAERERILDEVVRAYRFNTDVFDDLARAKAAAATAG